MQGDVAAQPLEVEDFSGGMTDYYVNGALNRGQLFENIFILPNKKLKSRWGSDLDVDDSNAQIPAGNQRIGALINYNNSDTLLVQSSTKFYYRNPTAYSTLTGPSSNDVFNAGSTTSYISFSEWNRHLFVTNDSFAYVSKIYKDSGGTLRVRTAGLPALASDPTVTAGTSSTRSYIYAFHYYYSYTVGSQTFEDRGPVTEVQLTSSGDPSINNNAITAIPVLANGGTLNYDTTVIKVHIFRTLDSGTELFKIGQVTNGTTTFTDNVSDATAENGESIYTSGGVLDNNPPPLCKYLHIVNNLMYYGHIQESGETLPNEYGISIAFDPDSCPTLFRDTVEDEIAGINSAQSIPIILCKRHIYRSEGSFDETGRGSLTHFRISDTAGCISNLSCIQAEGRLYWAGNDGFYSTDGYTVLKISDHLPTSYANYVAAMDNPKAIVGTFDEKYRRIIWTVQSDSANADNDTCIVLELRWGVSNEMTFTTMTGGDSFRPTSVVYFNKKLYRADYRGYVFYHDETLSTDRKVDTTIVAADWVYRTIMYDYKGPAFGFGTTGRRKWIPRVVVTLGNNGNVSFQINAINDDGVSIRALKPIRYRDSFTWDVSDFIWGDPNCKWGVSGIVERMRRMKHGGFRASYLQLEFTNAYSVVQNSDFLGNVTLDATADTFRTATLGSSLEWGSNTVDYYLSFALDNYVTQYPITSVSGSDATFQDASGVHPAGGATAFLMSGYPKNEVMSLLSYSLRFGANSDSQKTYTAAEAGNNA